MIGTPVMDVEKLFQAFATAVIGIGMYAMSRKYSQRSLQLIKRHGCSFMIRCSDNVVNYVCASLVSED